MTPDMKRLCNEAWRATQAAFAEGKAPHEVNEAIVRAVLIALRGVDYDAQLRIADLAHNGDPEDRMGPSHIADVIDAIINHILAEPAKA